MIEVLFIKAKVRLEEIMRYGLPAGCLVEYDDVEEYGGYDPEDRKPVLSLAHELVNEELGRDDDLLTEQLVERMYEYLTENYDIINCTDPENMQTTIYCDKELNIKSQEYIDEYFMS